MCAHFLDDDDAYDAAVKGQTWWVGVPNKHNVTDDDQRDAFFSKLGGTASLLRAIEKDAQCPMTRCTQCGKSGAVRLLCQFYAPLEDIGLERVLYLLQCDRCSTKEASHVFAYRSTAYNPAAELANVKGSSDNVLRTAEVKGQNVEPPIFAESDDWGDDAAEEPDVPPTHPDDTMVPSSCLESHSASATASAAPHGPQPRHQHPFAVGTFAPNTSTKLALPCIALDVFEEPHAAPHRRGHNPQRGSKTNLSADDQLADAERSCGGDVVDRDSVEVDEETPDDRCSRRYMDRIGNLPSQCVRWCHGGAPLLCRLDDAPPPSIPQCECCGAPRVFECELVSPAIFFLAQGLREDQHSLHFGTVLCYTCSSDCDDSPYVKEYCFVQKEI